MNHINGALKKLVFSHTFFLVGRIGMRLFMSLFIWTVSKSLYHVALFEITFLLTHTTVFRLFAPYVKKGHVYVTRNAGLVGTLLSMLIIAMLGEEAIRYLIPVAMFYAVFNSLYWLSHHTLTFDLTHVKNRGNYTGHEQAGKITAMLLTPLIGGYLITANFFGLGYANVFIMSAAVIFIAILAGTFHTPVKSPKERFNMKETLSHIRKDNDFKKVLLAGALVNYGKAGVMSTILPIFLLTVVGTELHVGGWISFFAVLSIVTSFTMGKHVHYKDYKSVSLLSGSSLAASLAFLIASPGLFAYALFGSIDQISKPLSAIARRTYYQNLLHRLKDHKKHRIEYVVIREWVNIITRTLGYIPLLFVTDLSSGLLTLLLSSMALALFIEPFLIRSIKTDLTKIT